MTRNGVLLAMAVVLLLLATVAGLSCTGAQGPQGEPGASMIVAMGAMRADGTVAQGYNVNTSQTTWDEDERAYLIPLTGIDYVWGEYVTIVTPTSHWVTACGNTDVQGQLYVRLLDSNGDRVQGFFTFVLLEMP